MFCIKQDNEKACNTRTQREKRKEKTNNVLPALTRKKAV